MFNKLFFIIYYELIKTKKFLVEAICLIRSSFEL